MNDVKVVQILKKICTFVFKVISNTFTRSNSDMYFFYIPSNYGSTLNPLYTGGLFHCYMLDKSICHFRGAGSMLLLLFYF